MSKGETWFKKLKTKSKQRAMRERYGNAKPLMGSKPPAPRDETKVKRDATGKILCVVLERREYGGPREPEIKPFVVKEYEPLPKKAGHTIRPWGRKGHSGCVMSAERREAIKAHDARLNAQVRALIAPVS